VIQMNKMAFFVEGFTEMSFVEKLIESIAKKNSVRIECRKITGGASVPRKNIQLKAGCSSSGQDYFVLIHDCEGDAQVKTRMTEEYEVLVRNGYSRIVCIRDVRPDFTRVEVPLLEAGLPKYVKTKPIVVDFILSVMEIEAWFLAEHSHFGKIDPGITLDEIIRVLNFNPAVDDTQLRDKPAEDLGACYGIAGKQYEILTTVENLDYAVMYFDLVGKFPYLKRLCDIIESFLNQKA
jgi:hypothetical protein